MSVRKIRVGVSGHDLKFWYPLQRALESTGGYEFREDVWSGHDQHDPAKSQEILNWADVLVAEWALGNAVYYSHHKRPDQRLVIRLHLQERGTDFPTKIDYSNVERVLFVGAAILRECQAKFSIPAEICQVLGNFVDVARYELRKFGGAEYTLGIVGTAPARKRLDLAVDTLEILAKQDSRYCLRVKGQSPASIPWLWARTAERGYYERVYSKINSGDLRYRVIFDPQGNDVHHWFQMVGSILSPSDFESFHMAIAEGAASGAVPVVWQWEGADEIYPEFPLVRDAMDAAEFIQFNNRSAAGPRYRHHVRDVIKARYDSSVIRQKWDDLLSGGGRASKTGSVAAARGRGVLVVWAIDNWRTFHRREMLEALARNLGDGFEMLVVEPGNHYATIQKLGWADAGEMERCARGELIDGGGNVRRVRLFTGGIPGGVDRSPCQGSSTDPLAVLDGLVSHHYGDRCEVLHWAYKPDQAQKLGKRRFVYEVYDDYTFDFGSGTPIPDLEAVEREILQHAEHVFFTSQPLLDRKSGRARAFTLVGNGVASEVFARYRPEHRMRQGRPVAGYLGNLASFFDWPLMAEVCAAMPAVDFVFHGQIELPENDFRREYLERMQQLDNVVFTGRVDRVKGAAAINRYDVLLIPFVVNDAMHAVNPLKLWEYFATGLPVVSSPMDAISESPSLLAVAREPAEWIQAIEAAIDETDEGLSAARIARAEEHRWESLTAVHAEVVKSLWPA